MKLLRYLLIALMFTTVIHSSEESPTEEEVAKLYVATFNRAPDAAGLSYWTNDSGLKLSEIAQSFFDQPETQALYPEGTSNRDFISSVYQNLFNREPDTAGWNYWEDELDNGAYSKNLFIQTVINGAQNNDTSNDADILTNKTSVGLSFADAGLSDVEDAKTIMTGVSDTLDSVNSAIASFGISLYSEDEESETPSASTSEEFDTTLQNELKTFVDKTFEFSTNKAGISVAVYQKGKEVWSYALGKASESADMTVETPSIIYSVTKSIVATQTLKLIEDGELELTDTISDALNGSSVLSELDTSKINLDATISELMSNTSGIQDYADNQAGLMSLAVQTAMGSSWSPTKTLALIPEDYKTPGSYKYSGSNFMLLGLIIEHKTGLTLSEALNQYIFSPIGVSGYVYPTQSLSNMAVPYDDLSAYGGSGYGLLTTVQPFFMTGMGLEAWGAAGGIMTAQDLAKVGYETYSSNGTILSDEMKQIHKESVSLTGDENYGYAVGKNVFQTPDGNELTTYGHGGGGYGYTASIAYSPELDLSVSFIQNGGLNFSFEGATVDGIDFGLSDGIFVIYNRLENQD